MLEAQTSVFKPNFKDFFVCHEHELNTLSPTSHQAMTFFVFKFNVTISVLEKIFDRPIRAFLLVLRNLA